MTKGDLHTNKEVLRLCRNINKRANDIEKLQPLVFELNEVLRRVSCETRATEATVHARDSNPFDRIMVA